MFSPFLNIYQEISSSFRRTLPKPNFNEMNKLQTALKLNAIFSGISGILLIVLNHKIAKIFGTENHRIFWIIGLALVFFSITIIVEIIKQRSLAILWVIVQDFIWVIGSIVLLVLNPFPISIAGKIIIGIVALIVMFMGVNQAKALAKIDNNLDKKGKQWRFERIVKADKIRTWKLISDVGNYALFAPNIDEVKIISGDGLGMVRTCSHGKDTWAETCTLWTDEKEYAYVVHTTEPDYPYPFKFLNGFWAVEEIDKNTSKIVLRFEFQYNKEIQNILLHPLFRTKFFKIAEELLDNWQSELERK